MRRWVGIDPGRNGGLAQLFSWGVSCFKFPESRKEVLGLIRACVKPGDVVVIEKQWARPSPAEFSLRAKMRGEPEPEFQQGRGTVASARLMEHYGQLCMALTVALEGEKFEEVAPLRWQNRMGCRTGGDKNRSKAEAQARFPSVKCFHWNSDALLLAAYARAFYPEGTS